MLCFSPTSLEESFVYRSFYAPEMTIHAFPFRILQLYLVMILVLNGISKLPYWKMWVLQPFVYDDAKNWNELSPFLASKWDWVETFKEQKIFWKSLGLLVIAIEIVPLLLLWNPNHLIWIWPLLFFFFLGNHLLRTTSFLILPWMFLISFLPWVELPW